MEKAYTLREASECRSLRRGPSYDSDLNDSIDKDESGKRKRKRSGLSFQKDDDEDPANAQDWRFASLGQVPIDFSLFGQTHGLWILPSTYTIRPVDRRGTTKTKQEHNKSIFQIELRSVFLPHGAELHQSKPDQTGRAKLDNQHLSPITNLKLGIGMRAQTPITNLKLGRAAQTPCRVA
ncbi:hypothetical protein U1Q18_025003 [Sarracenia purpurea var. burkii]